MNQVQTDYKSALQMDNIFCNEIRVNRSVNHVISDSLKMQIHKNIKYEDDFKKSMVTLKIKIFDENGSINVEVSMVGIFKFEQPIDTAFAKSIMAKNTVAIMFPYLRSQVSLVTTQPDMSPIVIPAININALIESQETE